MRMTWKTSIYREVMYSAWLLMFTLLYVVSPLNSRVGFAQESQTELTFLSGGLMQDTENDIYQRILDELSDDFHIKQEVSLGSYQALEMVWGRPNSVAIVQRNIFDMFRQDVPLSADTLEIYGSRPICLFAVLRKNMVNSLTSNKDNEISVKAFSLGPRDGDTAISLQRVIPTAPIISSARADYRGGTRAISALRDGNVDVHFFMDFPTLEQDSMRRIIDDDSLDLAPNILTFLKGANGASLLGFLPTEVELRADGFWEPKRSIRTICTSVGLVVNNTLPYQKLDKIVRPISEGYLEEGVIISLGKVRRYIDDLSDWMKDIWSRLVQAWEVFWGGPIKTPESSKV